MPFFRRKKDDEFVGLEEEECNLRDMFGDPPGAVHAEKSTTSSSEYIPTSEDGDSSSDDSKETDSAEPVENKEAQEVMNDNLELMREVVMRIREDEEYAKNIYANCPRLQLLLNEHPDLKPLFSDPRFVVLNFEKVYRDAGGTLPGDEDAEKKGRIATMIQNLKALIGKITSHPLFKVFKVLMLIKKIVFFFSPTKFMGIFKSFLWPSLDDMELDADGLDPDDPDYEAEKTKLHLNNAADRLENPEIQEQLQEAMEDPDKMDEMIEGNKELRELRDSNPLCAEMMNDPETLKIISDPENLRALSECPDLISEDLLNPDMLADALENAELDADVDIDADVDADAEVEAEVDDDGDYSDEYSDEYSENEYSDEEDEEEEEEESDDDDLSAEEGMLDDVEYEREDDDNNRRERSRGKARSANQQKKRDAAKDGEGGGGGGRFGLLSTLAEAGLGGIMDGGMFEGDGFDLFGGGDEMEGLEGGEEFGGGGDDGFLGEDVEDAVEDLEEVGEEEEGDDMLENLEDIEEPEKEQDESTQGQGDDMLATAEENLEDIEEPEREQDESTQGQGDDMLAAAEDNFEDIEETEREQDESTQGPGDELSEGQEGMYSTMEDFDDTAAGEGADIADEFEANKDNDKSKDKEARERDARNRGGGGFYGDYDSGGFASGFQGDDPDDDWIQY